MTVNAQITITGNKTSLQTGMDAIGPINFVNANSGGARVTYNLVAGNNTIVIPAAPSGATYGLVILVPPPLNAVALTLKGVNGDTGITLTPTAPLVLGANSQFVINAASSVTLEGEWV